MKPRQYQLDAIRAVYDYLRDHEGDPCVVIPTGGGKTIVLATICSDAVNLWGGRVVVLAHVKELLEQAADKIRTLSPDLPIGVYSAGLGSKDLGYAVTIAGIQSVYQKAKALGPVDLIVVDECHLIPDDGDGMYRQFLREIKEANQHARVVGLTATPYRMKTGTICGPASLLTEVCYEVGVRELIAQGYLCPLRSKAGIARVDTTTLHTRAGEFIASEAEALMDEASVVQAACAEIVDIAENRKAALIFCAGIDHGRHVVETIEGLGHECGFVEGNTPADERAMLLERFKDGDLKFLANVNVLTTGFDAPNIDLVAMLRPTLSPGLFYQMVGRGFRMCDGKSDCIVLDYGGNVMRHGPVDAIKVKKPGEPGSGDAPAKECPACMALVAAGYAVCPECEFVFPKPESRTHSDRADEGGVLSGDKTRTVYPVTETCYYIHIKRGDKSAPLTMRVEYKTGFSFWEKEWVCFDHDGYARTRAEKWWKMRSDLPVPRSVEEAVRLARLEALAEPSEITVEKTAGKKWTEIVDYKLGPKPEVEMPDDYEPVEERDPYMAIPDDCPF